MNWNKLNYLTTEPLCSPQFLLFLTTLILKNMCVVLVADSEGKLSSPRGSQLVHMTLMMHSWVVPSQMFAQKLLTLYPQLSLSAIHWSLWSTAPNHMSMFINQIRKQAWLCFALLVYKADLKYILYIPAGVWCNVVPYLHSVFRSLTLSPTHKDCPSDKRDLRRTQICHFIRWVGTPGTWVSCMTDCDKNWLYCSICG